MDFCLVALILKTRQREKESRREGRQGQSPVLALQVTRLDGSLVTVR